MNIKDIDSYEGFALRELRLRCTMHFLRSKRVLVYTGSMIIPGCVEVLCGLAVGPPHRPARVRAALPTRQGLK